MLGISHKDQIGARELWIKIRRGNDSKYVSLDSISQALGPQLCNCLPAIHELSGYDSKGCFTGIAKLKPFRKLQRNPKRYVQMGRLGISVNVSASTIKCIEEFICSLYNTNGRGVSINKIRHHLFGKHCKKPRSVFFKMPPTLDAPIQHIKRANIQLLIWHKALIANPRIPPAVGNGWRMEEIISRDGFSTDNVMFPQYITRKPAPEMLNVVFVIA